MWWHSLHFVEFSHTDWYCFEKAITNNLSVPMWQTWTVRTWLSSLFWYQLSWHHNDPENRESLSVAKVSMHTVSSLLIDLVFLYLDCMTREISTREVRFLNVHPKALPKVRLLRILPLGLIFLRQTVIRGLTHVSNWPQLQSIHAFMLKTDWYDVL